MTAQRQLLLTMVTNMMDPCDWSLVRSLLIPLEPVGHSERNLTPEEWRKDESKCRDGDQKRAALQS